jgi:hypothetical protein
MLGASHRKLTVSCEPWTMLTTPGGLPASSNNSTNLCAHVGTRSEGFRMKVLPVVMAKGNIHKGIIAGKLKGAIPPHTPRGTRYEYVSMPALTFSTVSPIIMGAMPQANSTTSTPRKMSPLASAIVLPCVFPRSLCGLSRKYIFSRSLSLCTLYTSFLKLINQQKCSDSVLHEARILFRDKRIPSRPPSCLRVVGTLRISNRSCALAQQHNNPRAPLLASYFCAPGGCFGECWLCMCGGAEALLDGAGRCWASSHAAKSHAARSSSQHTHTRTHTHIRHRGRETCSREIISASSGVCLRRRSWYLSITLCLSDTETRDDHEPTQSHRFHVFHKDFHM